MLKRQSKVLSIALIFVFCMSFMFAGFAAPDQAVAASNYSVIKTENVSATGGYITNVMIQVDVPNILALSNDDIVTLHLPTGLEFDNNYVTGFADPKVTFAYGAGADQAVDTDPASGTYMTVANATFSVVPVAKPRKPDMDPNLRVFAPAKIDANNDNAFSGAGSFVAYAVGKNTVDIVVKDATAFALNSTLGRLVIELKNVLVTDSFDGDIAVNFLAPANGGFDTKSG